MSVLNVPALTNTQLRSSALPVSVAVLPLPTGAATATNQATEISALQSLVTNSPALVNGAVPISNKNITVTANLASLSSTLISSAGSFATIGVQVIGSGAGFTLVPQASQDGGSTYITVGVLLAGAGATSTPITSITTNGNWEFSTGGYTHFQLLNTIVASSGIVSATLSATNAQKFIRSSGIGEQADIAATSDTGVFSLISLIKRIFSRLPALIGGAVPTVSSNPISILAGQQTGTASAVSLPSNVLVNGIIITALIANTGPIYIGPVGVTAANGYPLAAGQAISYGVTNSNAIFISGAVGSVAFTGN